MDDIGEGGLQHERARLDVDRPRIEAREVEQILEQPAEPLALLDADPEQLVAHLIRELAFAVVERLDDSVDRRRRRPQLVRGDCDEIQLELVELDELLVQASALDGDRHPLGDELE